MKKLIVLTTFLMLHYRGFSQELGVRFGDAFNNHVAIDGIFQSGKFNRIHADVSFGSGLGVEALWDFEYRPLGNEALLWYAGVGPSLFFHDPIWFGVSGEIGLEYRFNGAPIAIGIDWRPTLFIVDETEFATDGFGFNARYVFGKSK